MLPSDQHDGVRCKREGCPTTMLLALLIMLAVAPLPTATVVTATDLTTGRAILCMPAQPITLVFTHSMYGGDVQETFVPRPDGRITRTTMTTANAAAAEYYAYTAPVVRDGDRFRIDVSPASYDEVIIRVDAVGNHRLRIGDREIDLLATAGDGHRVQLDAASVTIVGQLIGDGC